METELITINWIKEHYKISRSKLIGLMVMDGFPKKIKMGQLCYFDKNKVDKFIKDNPGCLVYRKPVPTQDKNCGDGWPVPSYPYGTDMAALEMAKFFHTRGLK